MKKQVTPEIICRLNQLMNTVCQHLAKEEYEKANLLQEEFYQIEETYDLFDKEFEVNGLKGLKEVTGKTLVPPIYKGFSEVYSYTIKRGEPIAATNDEGKFALVTTDGYGQPITSFDYDMIECKHHTSFYSCYKMKNEKLQCGLLNKKGKEIIPCEMNTIWDIHNNIIIVEKEDRYGLYTTSGLFIAPIYNEVKADEAGFLLVRKENEWGYISEQGNFIHENDEETLDHTTILALFPEW